MRTEFDECKECKPTSEDVQWLQSHGYINMRADVVESTHSSDAEHPLFLRIFFKSFFFSCCLSVKKTHKCFVYLY